jgi:hypothetical protein
LWVGAIVGIAQIFAFFELAGGLAVDRGMTAAVLGVPFWTTFNVILTPNKQKRKAAMDR